MAAKFEPHECVILFNPRKFVPTKIKASTVDTTQSTPFEGGPQSVRGSHTPNFGPDIQKTSQVIRS